MFLTIPEHFTRFKQARDKNVCVNDLKIRNKQRDYWVECSKKHSMLENWCRFQKETRNNKLDYWDFEKVRFENGFGLRKRHETIWVLNLTFQQSEIWKDWEKCSNEMWNTKLDYWVSTTRFWKKWIVEKGLENWNEFEKCPHGAEIMWIQSKVWYVFDDQNMIKCLIFVGVGQSKHIKRRTWLKFECLILIDHNLNMNLDFIQYITINFMWTNTISLL